MYCCCQYSYITSALFYLHSPDSNYLIYSSWSDCSMYWTLTPLQGPHCSLSLSLSLSLSPQTHSLSLPPPPIPPSFSPPHSPLCQHFSYTTPLCINVCLLSFFFLLFFWGGGEGGLLIGFGFVVAVFVLFFCFIAKTVVSLKSVSLYVCLSVSVCVSLPLSLSLLCLLLLFENFTSLSVILSLPVSVSDMIFPCFCLRL